jgi:uncharacterized membrane protein YbhN (UPF0104 family)
MKTGKTLWTAVAVTLAYLLALVWVDSRSHVFTHLPRIAAALPVLMVAALASYALRYARWQWLLRRAHCRFPLLRGWLAYLTGFAFTATPGKVGELVRIRYFLPLGVAPERVLAAFVFERACDLVCVLILAALAVQDPGLFMLLLAFVGVLLAGIGFLVVKPRQVARLTALLRRRGHLFLARMTRTAGKGLAGCSVWLVPADVLVALLLGLMAWGLGALSFVWLLAQLDVRLPFGIALAVYPTAMLAGAASMLPGGIGTTEVTIAALLALNAVPIGTGALAAVAIRVSGLWFSVVCGLVAIGLLEHGYRPTRAAGRWS